MGKAAWKRTRSDGWELVTSDAVEWSKEVEAFLDVILVKVSALEKLLIKNENE